MDQSVEPFIARYTRPDGTLLWDDLQSSRLRTDYGYLAREYDRGTDWFHQGEGNLFFYYLCLANPGRAENVARARRFAGFYTGDDPGAPNYDPVQRVIRAPRTGSLGPRWGIFDGEPSNCWSKGMEPYGLPRYDVAGITSYEDLKDPALARLMGQAMQERTGKGDVAAYLAVTTLTTNAFLLTGDETYRRWTIDYVDAWVERARANGDLLPDNVGLSGTVGESVDGKWYGDIGWFDYQPPCLAYPITLWSLSMDPADWEQIERIRALSGYDWRKVYSFRNKEENGHEAPWVRFLAGDNPFYPDEILREALGQVAWRMDLLRADQTNWISLRSTSITTATAIQSSPRRFSSLPWVRRRPCTTVDCR